MAMRVPAAKCWQYPYPPAVGQLPPCCAERAPQANALYKDARAHNSASASGSTMFISPGHEITSSKVLAINQRAAGKAAQRRADGTPSHFVLPHSVLLTEADRRPNLQEGTSGPD